MGNIENHMFEIYIGVYGLVFLIYGLLISLDRIRVEKYSTVRTILLLGAIAGGMEISIKSAIEDGEYMFLIYTLVLLVGIIILSYVLRKYSYNVFNLNKEETSSCIQKALDNINLKYKVNDHKIHIQNLGHIQIDKDMTMTSFEMNKMDDKEVIKNIVDNIKVEVYKYKLPKKILYKGGYTYMAVGFFVIDLLIYLLSRTRF